MTPSYCLHVFHRFVKVLLCLGASAKGHRFGKVLLCRVVSTKGHGFVKVSSKYYQTRRAF